MYYPIQAPYILDKDFSRHVSYTEEVPTCLHDFVICFWEMIRPPWETAVTTVLAADGCINLALHYDKKSIGYTGMRKTNFNFALHLPGRFRGVRLKPGAFEQLTGLPATAAMDRLLPLQTVDANFDTEYVFSLPFAQTKTYLTEYITQLTKEKTPNRFVTLFDELNNNPPSTTAELYDMLHFSPRQCQRLFQKHYGMTPQMALSILRFQYCLHVLSSNKVKPKDMLEVVAYYDQSHFIHDFKKNIGLTPLEYLQSMKDGAYLQ